MMAADRLIEELVERRRLVDEGVLCPEVLDRACEVALGVVESLTGFCAVEAPVPV